MSEDEDQITVYDDGPRYVVHDPWEARDRGYFTDRSDAELFVLALQAKTEVIDEVLKETKPDETEVALIIDRIAAVLQDHYYQATVKGPMCWCGAELSGVDAHPAHVAEVLVTELGLTDQTLSDADNTSPPAA